MNTNDSDLNLPDDGEYGLQELRSADPASGIAQPDLVTIREKVDTSGSAEVTSLSEHAARRARFPRWSYAAAASVLMLGVGTGAGYSISAMHSGTNQQLTSANSCKASAPNCNDTGTAGPQALIPNGSAGADFKLSGSSASSALSSSAIRFGVRPWLNPSDSLSDESGIGHAYILSTDHSDNTKAVANLVDAFNFGPHKIKADKYSTDIEETGSSARITLLTNKAAPLANWYYENPANGNDACNNFPGNKQPDCEPKTGVQLSDEVAISVAKEVFGKAGLDLENVTWETHSGKDVWGLDKNDKPYPYVQVIAHLTVEDNDTSLSWNIELAPDKSVIHANGYLAKLVQVADYETVGAKTATLRTHDVKWSQFTYANPSFDGNLVGALVDYAQGYGPNNYSLDLDDQGRPVLNANVYQAEITGAEPALGGFYMNGSLVMLPVYKLTDGKNTWMQLSVADKYLKMN